MSEPNYQGNLSFATASDDPRYRPNFFTPSKQATALQVLRRPHFFQSQLPDELCPQFKLFYLAAGSERKLGHEPDVLWNLVSADALQAVFPNFVLVGAGFGFESQQRCGLFDHTAVRHTHDLSLGDLGIAHQKCFYLGRE